MPIRRWQQPERFIARAGRRLAHRLDLPDSREQNLHDLLMLIGREMRRQKAVEAEAAKEGHA
jgi:hypothetical protein